MPSVNTYTLAIDFVQVSKQTPTLLMETPKKSSGGLLQGSFEDFKIKFDPLT